MERDPGGHAGIEINTIVILPQHYFTDSFVVSGFSKNIFRNSSVDG